MPKTKPYVVVQGDHLARIAHAFGADPDEIWSHPDNAEVASKRKPNLLYPGDVLVVPDRPRGSLDLVAGTANAYTARVPVLPLAVTFRDDAGPLKNEPYELSGAGAARTGETDGEGTLRVDVPVNVREVTVRFPRRFVTHKLHVGDMDPIEEPSGVRARLRNLGFYRQTAPAPDEDEEATVRDGLAAFQRAVGLEPNGVADAATLAALVERHKS